MEQELSADARKAVISIILNPVVQDAKAMQDFDSESPFLGLRVMRLSSLVQRF